MIFMIAEKLACSILDGNSMAKISSKYIHLECPK
jgi:hypothetical protein